MLISVGKVGSLGVGGVGATSGFAADTIQVPNAEGVVYQVLLGANTATKLFITCMRWAENSVDTHFLLTPNYIAGSMTVTNAVGAGFIFNEPVEVTNISGSHFYVSKSALSGNLQLIPIIT